MRSDAVVATAAGVRALLPRGPTRQPPDQRVILFEKLPVVKHEPLAAR